MLRKCNRLLAHILAFALVITTFGSDLTSANVFAEGSEQQVDQPASEELVNNEPVNNEPVNEETGDEEPVTEEPVVNPPTEEAEEISEEEESIEIPEGQQPKADTPDYQKIDEQKTDELNPVEQPADGQVGVKLSELPMAQKVDIADSKAEVKGMEVSPASLENPVPEEGCFSITYESNTENLDSKTETYSLDKLNEGSFTLPDCSGVFDATPDNATFRGWTQDGSSIITSLEGVEDQGSYTVSAMWKIIGTEPDPDTEQKDGVKLNGSYGSVDITVEAENGVLPVNSELVIGDAPGGKVDAIKEYAKNNTEGEIEKIDTFDVAVYMTSGELIQPKGTVNVTVNLKDGTSGKLKLFHFNNDFSKIDSSENTGTSITIALDNLSPFALVVTDEETPDVEEKKCDVDVFVTNGTDGAIDDDTFKQLLSLEEATEAQYKVGSVSLSEELVKSETKDVDAVKKALTELNKESLSINAKNTVGKFADKLTFEYSINGTEEAGYQLVLKVTAIDTKTVTYIARYYKTENGSYTEVKIADKKYITGDNVLPSDSNDIFTPKLWKNGGWSTISSLFTLEGEEVKTFEGISNIQEDATVYAKYLLMNLEGDTVDAFFFLLKRGESLTFTPDDPYGEYHQDNEWYYPQGLGIWGGYANNIYADEFADKITYEKPGDHGYKAIFNWNKGLDQSVIGYSYKPGTVSRIQEYIDSNYNASLSANDERFTVDDIRWYVYKSESASWIPNHLDGYVTAYVTYDSNYFNTKDEDQTRISGDKIKLDEKTIVGDNKFTSYPYEFLGWNTERDGSGTQYSATDEIVVDKKIVLYAQWNEGKKYRIKIQVDANGKMLDVEYTYNGIYYTNDLNVAVDAEPITIQNNNSNSLGRAIQNLLNSITSLGTLTVYAAGEDLVNTRPVAEKTETIDGISFTVKGLYTTGGKGIDYGDYPVDLHYEGLKIITVIDGKEHDIKDLFEVVVELKNGSETKTIKVTGAEPKQTVQIANLKIKKRNVTLTSRSDSKQYDGTALTNHNVDVTGEGFANGIRGPEGATYNITGSQTPVGSSPNYFPSYTLQKNTDANNYNITTAEGTLTVYNPGGDTPPSPPTPPTPPTVTPPAGQVLGATRAVGGDGAAVLGARRGRTEDSTNTLGRIITIIVAAGIGFTMIFIKRKKSEEE